MRRWEDEWQSVDVDGLTVDEARERLDVVRERVAEGVSYQGREEGAAHRHELEMKILKEADGWRLREELHASAARSAASDDAEAGAHEGQWTNWLVVAAALHKADTAQLAAETATPAAREQAAPEVRDDRNMPAGTGVSRWGASLRSWSS